MLHYKAVVVEISYFFKFFFLTIQNKIELQNREIIVTVVAIEKDMQFQNSIVDLNYVKEYNYAFTNYRFPTSKCSIMELIDRSHHTSSLLAIVVVSFNHILVSPS